ncbi:MAG: hypothetical protein JO179_10870 [Solirubrobacterales bacterium]|nr:hypothetical protein [Solirubrobacterales bacterium]
MRRTSIWVLAVLAVSAALVAGCGSGAQPLPKPGGQLLPVPGNPSGKIVLTPQGAQRLGLQTAPVRSVRATAGVVIPFASIVYDPSGHTFAFTSQGPLTFTEVPITVDHITGNLAYLRTGPRAGTQVVTVGAEELFGVQTGVLQQT